MLNLFAYKTVVILLMNSAVLIEQNSPGQWDLAGKEKRIATLVNKAVPECGCASRDDL